ncbi:hypothetical protein GPECTOR_6g524 [Gonium pectorale]|uniref:Uncharacterized protein n=1 Tax=Gonium pectorale TaxID=33097 RepID=A0A150GUQ1_GONPE|nr:hypothetical protein GPECTOR_6g524 [Gonium pectorale]|eukprot:KXZ53607.1 hypothetical protein GPECTOR_6g524 [Gonium pectorale]
MDCQHAYQLLLDPERRAKYDKTLQPRANSQVLSYLNARSQQRHGVAPRVPSRAGYTTTPELYSTMLELLQQVKVAAKHLEREIVGKDGRRGFGAAAAAASGSTSASRVVPPCTGGKIYVPDSECGEHECCEPWLYYAIQAAKEEEQQQPSRRRG